MIITMKSNNAEWRTNNITNNLSPPPPPRAVSGIIYAGLFCIAFFVCLKSCLNPFGLKNIDHDTSVFLTIAQGITRGQVPFRDFYDNKGPLTYLISAIGFALGRFTGVWITELVFICVSIFFAYKTALFFGRRFSAFTGTVLSFMVFRSFFYEVAGTEEYTLPFMMIALYIFTKYYFIEKNVSFVELAILGFCFASSVLIRINMFSLWFGFCAVLCVEAVMKHDFAGLRKYIAGFCTGIGVVTMPVLFYLYFNNALVDYIHQNFITGSSRGLSGLSFIAFGRSFFEIIEKTLCFIPLLAASVWIVKDFTGIKKGYYIGYVLAFILTVSFHAVIRTNFNHYNMVLTPFLTAACTFFIEDKYAEFSTIRHSKLCFVSFFCLLFSIQLAYSLYGFDFSQKEQSREDLILTGKIIDENTAKGDKIIFLGFPSRIYLFTQRDTASRYIYQMSGVDYEPNARKEFIQDLDTNQPEIIVLAKHETLPAWYAPVYELIAREYRLLSDENGYNLYKRNVE